MRHLQKTVLLLLLAASAPPLMADVYRYIDKHGRVMLTDKPTHGDYKRLVRTWKGWVEARVSGNVNWRKNQQKFDPTIRSVAHRYQLPHTLLHAVITAESYYDPNAVSRAGAVGLMQLMPETAKRYGVNDSRNPQQNIQGGSRYLHYLMKLFNNDLKLALAAYNAGETAVKRHGNQIPPYKETRNYVKKVIDYYRKYRETMS